MAVEKSLFTTVTAISVRSFCLPTVFVLFLRSVDRKAQFNEAAIVLAVAGKLLGITTACPRKTGNTFIHQTCLRKRAHMRTSACIKNSRLATINKSPFSKYPVRPPKIKKMQKYVVVLKNYIVSESYVTLIRAKLSFPLL